jgi:ribosomal protein S18 acetylase RimI-like enzyme
MLSLLLEFEGEERTVKCAQCSKDAVYKCSICQKLLCPEHVRFQPVCASCVQKTTVKYAVKKASSQDRGEIKRLVQLFWGEQEQLTFDTTFNVSELPAYVAKKKDKVVGFVSFTELHDDMIVAALGIIPEYQGMGVGRRLVAIVEKEAKRLKKKKVLVSTSNDDLPALAFYQRLGFQIYEVKPNAIAEKHGKALKGIGNLPIRDELRLQKTVR